MQTSGLKLTRGRIEQGVDFARENAKDIILWCLEPRGFGCRIRASGACSYIFQYRLRGGRNAAVRKLTIGKSSTFGPEEARTAARKYAQAVALGRDPQMEKMAARKVLTVSALFEIWCREEGPALSPQTLVNAQSHLRIQLKPLASKRIDEITKSDVARLHASLATVPYAANRAMATLSTLFSFAVRRDWVRSDAHPVKGLRRYREKHRVRMLGATEIARLWSALITLQAEERHFFAAPAIMLGMLTGWRVGEVRTLEWENVDLTLFEATIIGKTGARTAPFPRSSQKLLQWLFEVSQNFGRGVARGRYVFPSTAGKTAERAALSDWEHHRTWAKAVKLADVDNIRRHDLRHLIAGVIGSQTGSALRVKEALGHRSLAMSERYVAPISALQRQSTDQAAALVLALAEREEGSAVPLGR